MYDHATENFKEIPLLLYGDIPYKAHVLSLLERKNGQILVGTSGQGIFEVDFSNTQPVAKNLLNLISSSFILKLFEDKEENLWVITQDQGLFKIDSENNYTQYLNSKNTKTIYPL